jgi:hypothetical protein
VRRSLGDEPVGGLELYALDAAPPAPLIIAQSPTAGSRELGPELMLALLEEPNRAVNTVRGEVPTFERVRRSVRGSPGRRSLN